MTIQSFIHSNKKTALWRFHLCYSLAGSEYKHKIPLHVHVPINHGHYWSKACQMQFKCACRFVININDTSWTDGCDSLKTMTLVCLVCEYWCLYTFLVIWGRVWLTLDLPLYPSVRIIMPQTPFWLSAINYRSFTNRNRWWRGLDKHWSENS